VIPQNFRSFEGVLKDMVVGGGGDERSLEKTPTWAVVVVCSAFVIISILIEHTY
jgi:hypothetical protein